MTFIESSRLTPAQRVCTSKAMAGIPLALALLCCVVIEAADTIQLANVKPGLWETTGTSESTGEMPILPEVREAMAQMREAVAKMPPEQRAKMEALMNASGRTMKTPQTGTTVHKSCMKKEDLAKGLEIGDFAESCTRTLLSSSSTRLEMRFQCVLPNGLKQDGSIHIEVVNPENVKGSTQMSITDGGHTMNTNSSFSAKWLGPVCSKE
jgi:hypothetical protein